MAGTTAFVAVLLGGCVVLIVAVLAWAQVRIVSIQAGEQSRRK